MGTSCLTPDYASHVVVFGLDSSWFNVLNFVLFDIVLASIVFYVTGDIAGLSNSSSAVQQIGNRISAYNPPLVGVGLTCTRRNVYRTLALVRGAVMAIVLASNFLIEGSSCEIVSTRTTKVLSPGFVNYSQGAGDLYKLGLRRRGCQGRNGSLTYYGELREYDGCELREALMTVKPVYFGMSLVNRTVTFKEPCTFYTDNETLGHMHRWKCPGLGTIACRIFFNTSSDPNSCVGVVNAFDENENYYGYYCSGSALFPGRNELNVTSNRIARCRIAMNINVTEVRWVPLIWSKMPSLRDSMEIVYGAQFEEMKVNVTSPKNIKRVSEVSVAWFGLLGTTLLILAVLLFIDFFMRSKGHVPVANSEFGLGSLIANSDINNNVNPPLPIDLDGTNEGNEQEITAQNSERTPLLYVQNRGGVVRARGGTST